MYEIINKKKRGLPLSADEINHVVQGFTTGHVPDYQISALLMAIYFNEMNPAETAALTMAMANSGDRVDLSMLNDKTIDKHSTGGVGDKTTLVVAPIAAAAGLTVAKMSGRGLGHTGGTIDKLESIPGFRVHLSGQEFLEQLAQHGLCIAGQSTNLAPADKKIYALRDATATVDSIPLIAASVMSKKIAAGAKHILLDVKTGSGAFMKEKQDAETLAKTMVEIGQNCGRKTAAIITDMSAPLGRAIGNSLEVVESVQLLQSDKCADPRLDALCRTLAAHMLSLAGVGSMVECEAKVNHAISSGAALKKLADIVEVQGGDRSYIENPEKFKPAAHIIPYPSPQTGYIYAMDTEGIGLAAMALGAGRINPGGNIDHSAGILLHAKTGDYIREGQPLATFHTGSVGKADAAIAKFMASIRFEDVAPQQCPLVYGAIF